MNDDFFFFISVQVILKNIFNDDIYESLTCIIDHVFIFIMIEF